MPTKPTKSVKTTRPRNSKPKPKFKLMVLWSPPASLIIAGIVGLVLAIGGVAAMRYSNAATPADTSQETGLLWQDAPDAALGTEVTPASGQTGQLMHWKKTPQFVYGGGSVKVVTDPTHGQALQFLGRANQFRPDAIGESQRAEQVADIALQKGQTYWVGYDLWVSSSTKVAKTGWQSAWQIVPKSGVTSSKLWLSVNSRRDGLGLETATDSTRIADTPYDSWTRIVVGLNLVDDSRAWVEIWQADTNIVPHKMLPDGAIASGTSVAAMKAGVYRSPQAWDMGLKMANFKIGTSRSAVQ